MSINLIGNPGIPDPPPVEESDVVTKTLEMKRSMSTTHQLNPVRSPEDRIEVQARLVEEGMQGLIVLLIQQYLAEYVGRLNTFDQKISGGERTLEEWRAVQARKADDVESLRVLIQAIEAQFSALSKRVDRLGVDSLTESQQQMGSSIFALSGRITSLDQELANLKERAQSSLDAIEGVVSEAGRSRENLVSELHVNQDNFVSTVNRQLTDIVLDQSKIVDVTTSLSIEVERINSTFDFVSLNQNEAIVRIQEAVIGLGIEVTGLRDTVGVLKAEIESQIQGIITSQSDLLKNLFRTTSDVSEVFKSVHVLEEKVNKPGLLDRIFGGWEHDH